MTTKQYASLSALFVVYLASLGVYRILVYPSSPSPFQRGMSLSGCCISNEE